MNNTASTAPIALPACGCNRGPVARFVIVEGTDMLACMACFKELSVTGEVTHHIRGSHADCQHDSTPRSRAACRRARRVGNVYIEDGFGDGEELEDDANDVTHVGAAKGSKLVHAANEATGVLACGATAPKTLKIVEGDVDDVTCTDCMDAV